MRRGPDWRIALLAAALAALPHPSGAASDIAPAVAVPEQPPATASGLPAPAAPASPPPEVPAAAARELERGQDLYRQHQYAPAASALASADEKAGDHCGACALLRALAEEQLGHHRLAVELTRKAIGDLRQPRSLANADNQLAVLLIRSPSASAADLTAAEEALQRATSLVAGAEQGVFYANLAEVQRRAYHYPAAIETARQALAMHLDRQSSEQARVALCRARAAVTLAGPKRAWHTAASTDQGGRELPALHAGEGKVTKPKKLWAPSPPPARLGRVVVECIIDQEGCVTEMGIDRALDPQADQGILDTVQSWAFEPATLDGKPVSVHYALTVNFEAGRGH